MKDKEILISAVTAMSYKFQDLKPDFGSMCNYEEYKKELLAQIALVIQCLINNDFQKLINILYRIDVPEIKVKEIISTNPQNLALSIAELILDREVEKAEIKKKYKEINDNNQNDDEEKW